MKRPTNEEINELAIKYLQLRAVAEKGSEEDIKEFKKYQNICITKLRPLVLSRVAKYKKFSNYPDLEQDGFEALLMALNSYNPEKGLFSYWAVQYIKTKVSRSANAHSTIRIPMKKAREVKPYKTSTMPVMLDNAPNPAEQFQGAEDSRNLMDAIFELPTEQQEVINLTYGLNGLRPNTAAGVMEHLSISRQQYNKLMSKARQSLKKQLVEIED